MLLIRRDRGFFPRFISTVNILPKAKEGAEQITANLKRLRKTFGAYGGFLSEIKRNIEDSQWRCGWLVLVAEECGWY